MAAPMAPAVPGMRVCACFVCRYVWHVHTHGYVNMYACHMRALHVLCSRVHTFVSMCCECALTCCVDMHVDTCVSYMNMYMHVCAVVMGMLGTSLATFSPA